MRFFTPLALALCLAMTAQSPSETLLQTGQPIPPGHRAANDATRQSEKLEAPIPTAQKVTPAQLLQQADELVSLAQQVHADTQQATQGMLAKDLKDKLKRIEKLSKQLRQELALQ